MEKKDCFYLGKVVKNFSFKGELVLFFDVDSLENYLDLELLYIEIKGRLVPYKIKTLRIHGNKVVVLFEDLTPEEANILIGKDLYLPLDFLPELSGNQFYFHEVIGFNVKDLEYGDIGTIKEIYDNTVQPIFSIDYNGKEILIPIIDSVIKKVDREQKLITIQAPQGLIDVYLGEEE
ncbi:MAG: ribosome maturation factor RimM [Bacteroidales bacterium]|jgi:16S rRNA processing protein RimM|nr:ribosome maturation factor RimM [Bacteroidales bacterium]